MESVTRFRAQIRPFKRVNQSDCLLLWNHLEIGLLTTMTNKVGEQWVFRCSGLDANRLRAQQLQRDGKEEKKKRLKLWTPLEDKLHSKPTVPIGASEQGP